MTCVSPPELADRDLLAYLDGEADDQVIAHLEGCPHCRERARRLARLQDCLTAQLYRFDCLSPIELGEYQLGTLPVEQMAAVTQHLAECPRCAQEVDQLGDYLADLAQDLELSPLERTKERVRVLVARLVSGGLGDDLMRQPAMTPAYASVRGEEGEPLFYEADEIQVVLDVQGDPDQPDHKTILGLVIGLDDPASAEVHLWGADQHLATVPVDETGNFVFPNLAPGRYELILGGTEMEIHIQDLEIGTS
jgi:hypothetical protein